MTCFLLFLQKNALDVFEDGSYTCGTKTCYSKVSKLLTEGVETNVRWDCDGPNGPDMEPNSLSILVKWWMTEGNYAAYQGGKNHSGKLKDSYWADLALKIKEANIKVDRSAASIGAKIQRMEEQYRSAHDWLQNTGEGCLERGEDVTTYVKKLCPFF